MDGADILVGDFNWVCHEGDRSTNNRTDKSNPMLSSFLSSYNDLFLEKHLLSRNEFTFTNGRMASRIDRIYSKLDGSKAGSTLEFLVGKAVHAPVTLNLYVTDREKGDDLE
jgi:hypothetical protein